MICVVCGAETGPYGGALCEYANECRARAEARDADLQQLDGLVVGRMTLPLRIVWSVYTALGRVKKAIFSREKNKE